MCMCATLFIVYMYIFCMLSSVLYYRRRFHSIPLPHRKPAVSIPTEYIMRIKKNESMANKKLSSSSNNNPIKMWFGLWRWFALWFFLELLTVWAFSFAFVRCSTKQPPNIHILDRPVQTNRHIHRLDMINCIYVWSVCTCAVMMVLFLFLLPFFFLLQLVYIVLILFRLQWCGLYCVCIIRFAYYMSTLVDFYGII